MNTEDTDCCHGMMEREHVQQLIASAVDEVDPDQIAILRRLSPAQRLQQMLSMIDLVEGIGAYRLRKHQPALSEVEALRIIRSRYVDL